MILSNLQREHPITHLEPVVFKARSTLPVGFPAGSSREFADTGDGKDALLSLQKQVWEVHVDNSLQDYIIRLVGSTRAHADLLLGGSPRASLALYKTAQALAAVRGRDHVIPDDVKYLVPYTLVHRLIVRPESELRGRTAAVILQEVLAGTSLELITNE